VTLRYLCNNTICRAVGFGRMVAMPWALGCRRRKVESRCRRDSTLNRSHLMGGLQLCPRSSQGRSYPPIFLRLSEDVTVRMCSRAIAALMRSLTVDSLGCRKGSSVAARRREKIVLQDRLLFTISTIVDVWVVIDPASAGPNERSWMIESGGWSEHLA